MYYSYLLIIYHILYHTISHYTMLCHIISKFSHETQSGNWSPMCQVAQKATSVPFTQGPRFRRADFLVTIIGVYSNFLVTIIGVYSNFLVTIIGVYSNFLVTIIGVYSK